MFSTKSDSDYKELVSIQCSLVIMYKQALQR